MLRPFHSISEIIVSKTLILRWLINYDAYKYDFLPDTLLGYPFYLHFVAIVEATLLDDVETSLEYFVSSNLKQTTLDLYILLHPLFGDVQ